MTRAVIKLAKPPFFYLR